MTPNNFRVKSGLTVGTTISGGNTTITGFVNATSSVNAASHTVGTAFVANSTGTTVNVASWGRTFRASNSTNFSGIRWDDTGGTIRAGLYRYDNSDLTVSIYDNTGTFQAAPIIISASTGTVTLSRLSTTNGVFSGAVSGITTLAAGNTTITGFTNISGAANVAGDLIVTSETIGVRTRFLSGKASPAHTAGPLYIQYNSNDPVYISGGTGTSGLNITGYANVTSTLQVGGVSTFSGNVVLGSVGLSSNGSFGTAGHVLHSNGTATYWAVDDQGVTSVAAANGLNGGTITSTGTISVLGGSTLTVNTTGVHVNSTLSLTDLTLSGNLTVSGTRTYVNTTTLDVGDNIITLNADLGASAPSQDAGIEIMRGTSANVQFMWDETNDRWSTNSQPLAISSLIAAGAASGITTLAAGNTTITGFVNASASVNSAVLAVGTSFVANTTQVTAAVPVRINNMQQLRFQTVNTSAYAYFTQQNDDNFVFYTSNTSYGARAIWSIFANTNTSVLDIAAPLRLSNSLQANGTAGTSGQVLKTNGTTAYWDTAGGTGTVTSVATANGLTGGTITATGTLGVATGSTLTVNSTGIHVNSALSIDQVLTSNNGAGTNVRIGDDAWFGDVNVADTVRIMGQQSANNGYIVFGNADNSIKLGRAGTGALTWNGAFSVTGGLTTLSANLVMSNNNITNPILTGYTEHEVANAAVTGTFTMNCAAANFFDLTLTGNTTISPSNVPPSTRVWSGSIAAKQDATGGRTITWPTGTKYAGGVAPPATTTANALDIWSLMTYDGGTSWIVSLSVKGVA
jgi:hypothetical protein